MDKKINENILGFLYQNQSCWNNLWSEDANWDIDDIGACCSSTALQLLVSLINPKTDWSTKSICETIRPYLTEELIQAIEDWQCDDVGDNEEIEEIIKYCREILDQNNN